MKINIEVDCTPEEARQFLGLPDVQPIQEMMSEHMQERVKTAMNLFDPETLMKSWFPMGGAGLEDLQKAFWGAAKTDDKAAKSNKK